MIPDNQNKQPFHQLHDIGEEIGSGQPMAILTAENVEMEAWDLTLLVGGFQSKEAVDQAAELLKDILVADGFAARLERIQ